jgi:predicted anti-sigma-YlaC factor YlaD
MNEKQLPCDEVLDYICDNLDEDLHSPKCKQIKSHLDDCPDCRLYLESLKETIHLYRDYPAPPLSDSARKSIESFVERSGHHPRRSSR